MGNLQLNFRWVLPRIGVRGNGVGFREIRHKLPEVFLKMLFEHANVGENGAYTLVMLLHPPKSVYALG